MASLIDSASAILLSSEKRLEVSAVNIANASTPGYKRQVSFSDAVAAAGQHAGKPAGLGIVTDFAQGQLNETGKPLDLAIFGSGLFKLRDGDHYVYSRGGSFALGEGGALVDGAGRALQQAGGGDLTVSSDAFTVLDDGTVLEDGLPTGQVGVFEPNDRASVTSVGGSVFSAADGAMGEADSSLVRQGFTEGSNTATSDEMVSMMTSTRQAEGGAHLIQAYDELLQQAANTFNRSGR